MICFWVIKNAAEKPDDFRLSASITTLALPRWLFVEYWWSLISSSHLLCLKFNSFWMKMYFILLWSVSSKKKKKKTFYDMCVFHISHIQIMPQNLQCKDILVCYLDYLDRLVIFSLKARKSITSTWELCFKFQEARSWMLNWSRMLIKETN